MSDLDPQSRAGVALQKLTDLISPNMAYWKCSEALTQLEVLSREIADRDAQIARAVTLAATTALRTDPARLFELEAKARAFEALRSVWKNAETESDFWDFCVDFDWDPEP